MSARVPLVLPLVVAAAAVVLVTRQPVSDSDLFWHLAAGRDIFAGNAGVDHASWTILGRPLPLDEWLGEVLLFGAYSAGGWTGIIALRAIVVAALAFLVAANALSAAPRRPLIALVMSLPALLIARYVWTDRPELVGFLCFTILVTTLRAERWSLAIPPLLLVWSNVHGSYALGIVLTLIALGHRAVTEPERRRSAILIAALSVIACVPTLLRERVVTTSLFWSPPREIQEWSVPDVTTFPALMFGLVLVAVLVAAVAARRRDDRELVLLVPTLFVGMSATRHMPFFAIAAAPYLARVASEAWDRYARAAPRPDALGKRAEVGAAVLLALALAAGLASAPREPDLAGYPVAAVAAVPAGRGVLNLYDWGGYLIWFAPQAPVFIDGRYLPYTAAVLDDYRAIVAAHPGWEAVAARRGVRTIIVRPTDTIAVRAPDRGWRVAFADQNAVVLVR